MGLGIIKTVICKSIKDYVKKTMDEIVSLRSSGKLQVSLFRGTDGTIEPVVSQALTLGEFTDKTEGTLPSDSPTNKAEEANKELQENKEPEKTTPESPDS